MKKISKNSRRIILAITLVAATPIFAHDQVLLQNYENSDATITVADDLVGGWNYSVEGAPEGYQTGFMIIVKENDQYKVQIQTGGGTMLGENVVVKRNEISFNVMVEGGQVSVVLTAKGSELTGKSTSSEGSYMIKGVKSISQE